MIRKMAVKSRIGELRRSDKDAKEEVDVYIERVIKIILEKVPSKYKDFTEKALRMYIDSRWIVRNTRSKGEVSPKTGKNYSLIAPSPQLGYDKEEDADKRVKTMNKAGEISRARAAAKTIKEMESEITEEFAEEIMEEAKETNSKLADLMDEINISFGGRYGEGTGSFSERRGKLDKDLDRIMETIEADESYSQEELVKISQLVAKLHTDGDIKNEDSWEPFVSEIHKDRLMRAFTSASKKVNKSIWKGILKRSNLVSLIDAFLEKLENNTFEKDVSSWDGE